jgi:Cys-rich repeat protein
MRRLLPIAALALAACPQPPAPDGGTGGDDGGPPAACDAGPASCKSMGVDGVCRQELCLTHVPCADDLECGLGELCVNKECAFSGCVADTDCATGLCNTTTFACAECGSDADCPFDKPSCQMPAQKCVQCADDSQCPEPGPGHCDSLTGQCKNCTSDLHCPDGFKCQAGVCAGAKQGQPCSLTAACDVGLTCVQLSTSNICLKSCNAYDPQCPTGQICYTLKFTDTSSYVFDQGSLLGVCYMPAQNARNLGDSCVIDSTGASNCQPALDCVPSGPGSNACRKYCDPGAPGSCGAPDICHPFVGDFSGRQYGLCYADNGFGTPCTTDMQCRANEACVPYDDPSSFEGLSPVCQFGVGSAPALAPCGSTKLADGGTVPGNKQCLSGNCVGDLSPATQPYFCYGSCATDSDCTVAGRHGTCDGDYSFTSTGGTVGFITGCRPGCVSDATCAQYGDGGSFVCRPRLVIDVNKGGLKLNCGAPTGSKPAGESCAFNGECLSGFCSEEDSRGVSRLGTCVSACQQSADCADGGTAGGPIDCLPTTYLGYHGPDGIAGTPDDQLSVASVCTGVGCVQDDDCSTDGGARCAPDVSPADAGLYVLRCHAPAVSAFGEAGDTCASDGDCASGACGTLVNGGLRTCFRPCSMTGAACPGTLTCRAQAFRFTATSGAMVLMDGCAP